MNIPILGQPSDPGPLDLYDSEILIVEKVLTIIRERSSSRRDYDALDREIKERFYDAGFVVDVKWYHTNLAEVKMPEIEVVGRVERQDHVDHDRMRHEITNDILDLGQKGTIHVDSATVKKALEMERHKD